MADSDKDLTFIPRAPAICAASFARPLQVQRAAFQRGLGRAGVCLRTAIVFDDAGNLPALDHYVVLQCGAFQVFSERIASNESAALKAEERGAAAATAIRMGLIRGSNLTPSAGQPAGARPRRRRRQPEQQDSKEQSNAFRAEERGAACRTAIKTGLIRPPRGGARRHA
jgi:hypothetical protein